MFYCNVSNYIFIKKNYSENKATDFNIDISENNHDPSDVCLEWVGQGAGAPLLPPLLTLLLYTTDGTHKREISFQVKINKTI